MIDLDEIKQGFSDVKSSDSHVKQAHFAERNIPMLIAEIERLRAEATTTLIACERCGRGVRARYMFNGLCTDCAQAYVVLAEKTITGWSVKWFAEHDERVRLEERVKRLEGETRYLRDEVQRWADRAADGA